MLVFFIHLYLFLLLVKSDKKDGEPVEFEVIQEPNGRWKALNVTGPDGSPVQGYVCFIVDCVIMGLDNSNSESILFYAVLPYRAPRSSNMGGDNFNDDRY
jgi:hypothetical protein